LKQKDIADYIELDERSVRRALIALESDGFITRQARRNPVDGHRISDNYVLHFDVTKPLDHRTSVSAGDDWEPEPPTGQPCPVDYRTSTTGREPGGQPDMGV
jgi:hypothetical protein